MNFHHSSWGNWKDNLEGLVDRSRHGEGHTNYTTSTSRTLHTTRQEERQGKEGPLVVAEWEAGVNMAQ